MLAKQSQADLATKYGRSFDAIRQFSSRNSSTIATRRAELQGELNAETSHLWISDQAKVKARMQDSLDLAWSFAEDDELDPRGRFRYQRQHDSLLHQINELSGWLPPRTAKLEVAHSQLTDFSVIAIDEDGQFHAVSDS